MKFINIENEFVNTKMIVDVSSIKYYAKLIWDYNKPKYWFWKYFDKDFYLNKWDRILTIDKPITTEEFLKLAVNKHNLRFDKKYWFFEVTIINGDSHILERKEKNEIIVIRNDIIKKIKD
jgi:hypothetical protein